MTAPQPDRETYRREREGWQRELAHIYRERDMKDDYEAFIKPKTKEEVRAHQAELRGLMLLTALVVGITGVAIVLLW
ncbi:hypothetical protein SAMN05892877_12123 [Rhizobium subbaraonis]|uniref:Uncharacterized protein n=1 Tax=Rhizobium subbaraonis TaxID=908946 RepID=A0A285UWF1_9HYPH|nr:hypothetical protein SAMN05892877_12123 [Rhizobium subbaraonis]